MKNDLLSEIQKEIKDITNQTIFISTNENIETIIDCVNILNDSGYNANYIKDLFNDGYLISVRKKIINARIKLCMN